MTPPRFCQWCGAPATGERETQPATFFRNGDLKQRAIVADVCDEHDAMVDRNLREMELRRHLATARRRADDPRRDRLERELAELRDTGKAPAA